MKPIKIIFLTLALAMLSAGGFAQIRYGMRGEISLNNPSVVIGDLSDKVEQPPVLMFGVGGEIVLPVADMGVEAAMLYGSERVKMDIGNNQKTEIKSRFIDIPITLKKKFGLALPVKPVVSAGLFGKIYVSEDDDRTQALTDIFNKETFIAGLIAGAGVEIMNNFTVGVNYRYIFSGNNQRFDSNERMQKSLFTVSASAYF